MDTQTPFASPTPRGVTARAFFASNHPGGSVTDAHYGARIGLTNLKVHLAGTRGLNVDNANALQAWSIALNLPEYISAALTVGVDPAPVGPAKEPA